MFGKRWKKIAFLLILSVISPMAYKANSSPSFSVSHEGNSVNYSIQDLILNVSSDSLSFDQNSSLLLRINVVNTSSNTAISLNSWRTPTFSVIERVDEDTNISTSLNVKVTLDGNYWVVTRRNFLDYKPLVGWLYMSVTYNSSVIEKTIPLSLSSVDSIKPVITIRNLVSGKVYGKTYRVKFDIVENLQLLYVEILKDGQLDYRWDLYGMPTSNGSSVFISSTYFQAHSLPLGYADGGTVNYTVRAMDYSYKWTWVSVVIGFDSEGPDMAFLNSDYVTNEYLNFPHLEFKKSDSILIDWSVSDASPVSYFKVQIDGEYEYRVEESEIDLTGKLSPRSYAYTIAVYGYDTWMNEGYIEVQVLVLTDSGDVYREDLNGIQGSEDTDQNGFGLWDWVISFIILYIVVRVLFTTRIGKRFFRNSQLKKIPKKNKKKDR